MHKLHKYPLDFVKTENRESFDNEIESWIEEGILVKYDNNLHGDIQGYLPTMVVSQSKGGEKKVRPVLDYRQLNRSVKSFPGGSVPLCADQLRDWRQKGADCSLLDLRKAYLQVHIDRSLWTYQAVKWQDRTYLLTRLGFGLSVAPKIMTAIVKHVLAQNEEFANAVSCYIDDLFIDESKVKAHQVRTHLANWGLQTKEPVYLGDPGGIRVLGVRVNNDFSWSRDNPLPSLVSDSYTRRQIHSIIGEVIGHFPVAGWLRVCCSFLQRLTALSMCDWDDEVPGCIQNLVHHMMQRISSEGDPVTGNWIVPRDAPIVVWADASNLALGVVLAVNGSTIEDASWLRPRDDAAHINLSELDAVLKGINMALKWGRRKICVKTDSSTVYRWLRAVINKTHNVKTRALSERLIRRRLDTLREIIDLEQVDIEPFLVPSAANLADCLTRVPQTWLQIEKDLQTIAEISQVAGGSAQIDHSDTIYADVKAIHDRCHFGVDRTLNLARERFGEHRISKKIVKKIVSRCDQCAKIDPTVTFKWEKGEIRSSNLWEKLAIDITYYNGTPYLTVIDLLSRYTIWRCLRNESSSEVTMNLMQIMSEFGPPQCILSDNGTIFRSREFLEFLSNWDIRHQASCAYRHQGNGVIERMHRTVKRSARRGNRSIEETVFWVNNSKDGDMQSPFELMFSASSRKPGINDKRQEIFRDMKEATDPSELYENVERNPFSIGDRVYLRNASGKCDSIWSGPHRVTSIRSSVGVVLNEDGITRHVSHLRSVPGENLETTVPDTFTKVDSDEHGNPSNEMTNLRRSERTRRAPQWMSEFVCCVCEVCRPGGRVLCSLAEREAGDL